MLVDHALSRFSTDNLSCMVVRFQKTEADSAATPTDANSNANANANANSSTASAPAAKNEFTFTPTTLDGAVVEEELSPTSESAPTSVAAVLNQGSQGKPDNT